MAAKAVNFKMEERKILDIKSVASVYHMTITEVITEALDEYMQKMKNDPFYRLTANVEEADREEANEILTALDALADEDLEISSSKSFTAEQTGAGSEDE